MNERRYAPEELERLLALPEDHPERVAAEASPQFGAFRLMLGEFERPADALVPDEERASARVELRSRLTRAGHLGATAVAAATPTAAPMSARTPRGPGFLAWLIGGGGRPVFAAACAAIVVGLGWWATHRPGPEMTRAVAIPGAFELATRREGDALVLSWKSVAGADGYRVVFLGTGLAEAARQDVPDTAFALRAGSLPAGVAPGSRVSIEVVALRMGSAIATTPARSILLP